MDLRKVDQCEKMSSGVIELYASFLTELFTLSPISDEPPSTPITPTFSYEKPSFVPPHSDSITTCYFLTRILNEMNECVNDINSINMASDASGTLSTLMDQTRWCFIGIICETWNAGKYLLRFFDILLLYDLIYFFILTRCEEFLFA